jgi:hypothetical protein
MLLDSPPLDVVVPTLLSVSIVAYRLSVEADLGCRLMSAVLLFVGCWHRFISPLIRGGGTTVNSEIKTYA